jgi:hypothetical protein
MGRVVPLKTREGWEDCFISIHPQTKQIMSAIAVNAKIYNEYCGVTLTPHEKNELLDGRAIFVEGMKTIKDGVVKEFDATLQYNACTRRVDFYFDRNSSLKYGQELGKIPLTNKQVDEYNSGKAIFLDGYVKKNGEVDSFFVRRDPDTGKMEFSRRNQDNPSEVYVPSQINGVTINADERETLRKGGHIYLNNMTSRDGNEYSAYVKLNPETGYPMTSRTLEGFEEKREFKIPQEINGVTLTANQRAELQDGKPVLIEGMRVNGGTPYSQWAQVSQSGNRLNWYNENPDKLRETAAARRAAQIQAAPVKRDQKEEQKKGRKVA